MVVARYKIAIREEARFAGAREKRSSGGRRDC